MLARFSSMSILCGSIPKENRESLERCMKCSLEKKNEQMLVHLGFPLHLSRAKKTSHPLFVVFDLSARVRFYVKSASARPGVSSLCSPCWTVPVVWLALVA